MRCIKAAEIRIDGGTQSRAAIDEQAVSEYAEAMKGGDTFPPVTVYFDGSAYWLADGFHRYHAYERAEIHAVPADVRQGTQRDAILFSVGANAQHGLRRTNDDKRRAVLTLLNDPEWSKWPQKDVAKACGVSREYVSRMGKGASCDRSQDSVRTVSRGGATYQQDTANIGTKAKSDVEPQPPKRLPDQPSAPAEPSAASDDKERRRLEQLTPDAMVDEILGLRADLADEKAKSAQLQREKDEIAARYAEVTAADQGKTISSLQKQLGAAKYARDNALDDAKRMERRMKKALERVKELEQAEIAI